MIQEALKYLVGVGASAAKPELIKLPENRIGVVINGQMVEYAGDRHARSVKVGTLASLVDWTVAIGSDRDVQVVLDQDKIECWVDLEEAVSDHCELRLVHSKALDALATWCEGQMSLRSVVRLLRGPLAGTFDEKYLAIFRRVDFARANNGGKTIKHDGESLGRTIEKAAQSSAGEIPEVLTFSVPWFQIGWAAEPKTLRFAVDVDCDNEAVSLTPIGDCWSAADTLARQEIAEHLMKSLGGSLVLIGV